MDVAQEVVLAAAERGGDPAPRHERVVGRAATRGDGLVRHAARWPRFSAQPGPRRVLPPSTESHVGRDPPLEASFTSLLLQYTSFNCGNRPFHLFVTIAVSTPQGLQPLACLASPPILVDARKRTKGERPDACAGDVRLVQRQRTQVEASAAPLGGSNGALNLGVDAIELLQATASVVVLVGLDWTIKAALTADLFGYPPAIATPRPVPPPPHAP